jgi:hypothetical protein
MFKKTAAAALQFVLYRPTLLLVIALVVLLALKGPKSPPILRENELQAGQAASATSARLCAPGPQRSYCPRPVGRNEEEWIRSDHMTPRRSPASGDVDEPM